MPEEVKIILNYAQSVYSVGVQVKKQVTDPSDPLMKKTTQAHKGCCLFTKGNCNMKNQKDSRNLKNNGIPVIFSP